MKKILLVGNGLDIEVNSGFSRDYLLSKIIKEDSINIDMIEKFILQNKIMNLDKKLIRKILKPIKFAIKAGLIRSNFNDSIEKIILNITSYLKNIYIEEIFKKCLFFKKSPNNSKIISNFMDNKSYYTLNYEDNNNYKKMLKDFKKGFLTDDDFKIAKSFIKIYIYSLDLIKKTFCRYLENMASKSFDNPDATRDFKIQTKISGYDYILTTNYTNIIDTFVEAQIANDELPVDHIHGSINSSVSATKELSLRYESIKLLGINKKEETEDLKLRKNKLEKFRYWIDSIYVCLEINFDIFGFSINNDESLILDILNCLKIKKHRDIKVNLNYFYYSENDENQFKNFMKYIKTQKLNINICYLKAEDTFFGLLEYNKKR